MGKVMEREGWARLLIVDDDENTCITLADIFEMNGFVVTTARNGEKGLSVLLSETIDVVLLDIRLPDMEGMELMTRMQGYKENLIFIFMTGYASVEYAKKAYELGAKGFFVKPVLMEEVLHVIKEAIEKRDLEREYLRTELERNRALMEYEDLYNNAPDMFASVDAVSKTIVKCNQSVMNSLGYSQNEIVGMSMIDLYHTDSREKVEREIHPILVNTGVVKNKELKLLCKNGGIIPVILNGSVFTNDTGLISQFRLVWHNIAEQKKLEEQLVVSEKMTTIAGLAAGVAHEINTPLSGILQSIQLIEMGLDPANETNRQLAEQCGVDLHKLQEYMSKKELDFFLKGTKDAAMVAARIIADLLQFSRPNESVWSLSNLRAIIDRAIGLSKSEYTLKKNYNIQNVNFVCEYDSGLPEIKCMAMELEQVLINLIKNSCQAMVEGEISKNSPEITMRAYSDEKYIFIEVVDNGPGVPEENLHHIFDPFFTTKEVGVGTGLGLSVSYSIVSVKHGGKIWVESKPDDETRFIIQIPITQD